MARKHEGLVQRNAEIIDQYAATFRTMRKIGLDYGLSQARVHQIIARHCRRNGGLFSWGDSGYDLYSGKGKIHVLWRYTGSETLWAEAVPTLADADRLLMELGDDARPLAVLDVSTGHIGRVVKQFTNTSNPFGPAAPAREEETR